MSLMKLALVLCGCGAAGVAEAFFSPPLPRAPPVLHAGSYHIETEDSGVSRLVVEFDGPSQAHKITFETGRIGRQAHGAVTVQDGDTVLYSTACAEGKPGPLDFTPLRVDYQERFSAVGQTSGGYNKRDGRPGEKEILVGRLIDRPLRPMITPGWTHDSQLLTWVLSYDGFRQPEAMAITSSAAALLLSHIPLQRAVAGVQVGMKADGTFVVNPNKSIAEESPLTLTVAGTKDGILMIEGACDFLTEAQMVEAIQHGQEAVAHICIALDAWAIEVGKPSQLDTLRVVPEALQSGLAEHFTADVDHALAQKSKADQSDALRDLDALVMDKFAATEGEEDEEGKYPAVDIRVALKKLSVKRMQRLVKTTGLRTDGRAPDEVRQIAIEAPMLPRTHGSALFTRGDTQSIATATLGGRSMKQKLDTIEGTMEKRFYLQYTFPPSCVGEVGRVGAPGRREVGHGNLAERALAPVIPSMDDFPYSIRVESLITESSGSSSMASVCGGCLAMIDAGVPLATPIAGVAMGLILDEDGEDVEDGIVLTDITGIEDAFGTMDFKVAGNAEGITTFQLDIKCEGLTVPLLERALDQAKQGRLHILNEMQKALPEGKRTLNRYIPKFTVVNVPPETIGKVIGPGGKKVRQIIEDFGLENAEIEDDGTILLSSPADAHDQDAIEKASKYILALVADNDRDRMRRPRDGPPGQPRETPEIGKIYRQCVVKGVHNYGCFVEIFSGTEGLVHISELDTGSVRSTEQFCKQGDMLDVKLLSINEKGKLRLSRKAALAADKEAAAGDVNGAAAGASAVEPKEAAKAAAAE
ncbi:unnamed protein product [Chrysoparadoxa australica]